MKEPKKEHQKQHKSITHTLPHPYCLTLKQLDAITGELNKLIYTDLFTAELANYLDTCLEARTKITGAKEAYRLGNRKL